MEQNFKNILKQLLIAAFVLISVTVLSFGIRQVRLGAYRADSDQFTASTRPSDTEDKSQLKQILNTEDEQDFYPDDSYTVEAEEDSQYADKSNWDEQAPSDDYSETETNTSKKSKAVFKTKSFKGGYAKSEGKSGLKKISLSDNENIYITENGEAWYVTKQPDGKTSKMQVQVDDYTGEITPIGSGYYGESQGSQDPQRRRMSDNEDIYLTEEGETWYVNEQPDGSTTKVQLQPD